MSAATSPQQTAKPGTACLGCRRRKLKCSREEEGCANCARAALPCVYPAPQTGEKRKRGPYKKDKPARERHLEDLVKYLEPKASRPSDQHVGIGAGSGEAADSTPGTNASEGSGVHSVKSSIDVVRKSSNSEDLVKDALVALTKAHVTEQQQAADTVTANIPYAPRHTVESAVLGQHPPPRRIFEYFFLYCSRVDQLLKVIHVPSFAKTLFDVIDNLKAAGPGMEALLFAIYHIAVSTCTPREARRRFGESRDVLLKRYGRIIESTLADNYSMPKLESLQALVMYIVAIRREDSLTSVTALFSLAVRMAQLIGLNKDPGDNYLPFEAEFRRRTWWHICGLESRGAEEGSVRKTSVMDGTDVKLPCNLNDGDLDPETTERPIPRSGITDMTWLLLRSDAVRLVYALKNAQREHQHQTPPQPAAALKAKQRKIFEETQTMLETNYLRHLHPSRPYDWLCIAWVEGMLIKCNLIITHPFSQTPTKDMPPASRFALLQSAVDIIRLGHACSNYRATEHWAWFFRGWVQWHCIAIVVAELGTNTNVQFVNNAWAVLDPILAEWESVYQAKREEAAWEHVNEMIERARQKRREMSAQGQRRQAPEQPVENVGVGVPASYGAGYPGLANVAAGALPGVWQTDWGVDDGMQGAVGPVPGGVQMSTGLTDVSGLAPNGMPLQMGAVPMMSGMDVELDYNDFNYADGLDNIDFSAFEGVFGDTAWDFSSPSTDFGMNVESMNS